MLWANERRCMIQILRTRRVLNTEIYSLPSCYREIGTGKVAVSSSHLNGLVRVQPPAWILNGEWSSMGDITSKQKSDREWIRISFETLEFVTPSLIYHQVRMSMRTDCTASNLNRDLTKGSSRPMSPVVAVTEGQHCTHLGHAHGR